ncbi:MAG: YceI family protein [Chloroflexota bacterium]
MAIGEVVAIGVEQAQRHETAKQAATVWRIDPTHASAEFAVRHLMVATVKGRFSNVQGSITIDEAHPERSSVEATIDATTVDTHLADRDDHLRSADFLNVERYPTLTYRSTAVERLDDNLYRILGDLTIRDVTRPVALEAEFHGAVRDPWGNRKAGVSATGRLNRIDFGLTWNLALETGGFVVGDDVKIAIEFEAIQED